MNMMKMDNTFTLSENHVLSESDYGSNWHPRWLPLDSRDTYEVDVAKMLITFTLFMLKQEVQTTKSPV